MILFDANFKCFFNSIVGHESDGVGHTRAIANNTKSAKRGVRHRAVLIHVARDNAFLIDQTNKKQGRPLPTKFFS